MRYVLDSCVAFKWEVPEVDTDRALRLRDESRQGHHELIAPRVFSIEIAHALTKAERQGRVTSRDGWRLWCAVMTESLTFEEDVLLLPRAYAISSAARIGIYDCLYVALAERKG
jgi:predicted nucleic acid-binding protein